MAPGNHRARAEALLQQRKPGARLQQRAGGGEPLSQAEALFAVSNPDPSAAAWLSRGREPQTRRTHFSEIAQRPPSRNALRACRDMSSAAAPSLPLRRCEPARLERPGSCGRVKQGRRRRGASASAGRAGQNAFGVAARWPEKSRRARRAQAIIVAHARAAAAARNTAKLRRAASAWRNGLIARGAPAAIAAAIGEETGLSRGSPSRE